MIHFVLRNPIKLHSIQKKKKMMMIIIKNINYRLWISNQENVFYDRYFFL